MSKMLQDALKAAEALSEADQAAIAESVMKQVADIQKKRGVADRREQVERILKKSPLHGHGEEFRRATREFREGFRFKHDLDDES